MGERIFKLILEEYNPSNEPITFIDLLNQLEKLGFIENTNEWLNLRKIRNEISHQYDDEPEEISLAINSILNQKNIIKNIFLNLKKQYQKSN